MRCLASTAPTAFESFSRMPIIDGHLHVWRGYKPELIWETLSAVGVQRCNALSLNIFDHGGTYNAEALDFKRVSNGMAYAFGSIDYTRHLQGGKMSSADLVDQARQIKASGFDGIKMWEGKPVGYILLPDRLDGEFFDPFFAWMETEGFPIILHLADAPRFWDPARKGLDLWNYAGELYPTRQQMYAELENILDRHPRLKLILAHFLFLWGELAESAPNPGCASIHRLRLDAGRTRVCAAGARICGSTTILSRSSRPADLRHRYRYPAAAGPGRRFCC